MKQIELPQEVALKSTDTVAIRVQNLSKCFRVYDKPHHRLMQGLFKGKQYFKEFWALKDISFEIKKGETVGIIGRNGSGKSTLLQIICGTLASTTGTVEVNGRVAALLELGAGFNPEFTGRENVYMNAAILGLSRDEIDNKYDDIVAFADIGEFIEQPVKTYSSGMFVRLAFAVNIISEPDIMIVDEALAVGDMSFQAKCMTALMRIQKRGATVLFVSHDVATVKSLCSQGVYLEHGSIKAIGAAPDVAEQFIKAMREEMNADNSELNRVNANLSNIETIKNIDVIDSSGFKVSSEFEKRVAAFRYGDGGAKITYVELLNEQLMLINHVEFNQTVLVRVYFETKVNGLLACNYYIADDKKNLLLGSDPLLADTQLISAVSGEKYIVTYKTRLPLQDGHYSIQAQITIPLIPNVSATFLDVVDDAMIFNVGRRPNNRIWTKVFIENVIEVKSC